MAKLSGKSWVDGVKAVTHVAVDTLFDVAVHTGELIHNSYDYGKRKYTHRKEIKQGIKERRARVEEMKRKWQDEKEAVKAQVKSDMEDLCSKDETLNVDQCNQAIDDALDYIEESVPLEEREKVFNK
tara:strand:+ start:424 stop:804 length:381 start_codon:yes stop_codon:yes gene_type:complete